MNGTANATMMADKNGNSFLMTGACNLNNLGTAGPQKGAEKWTRHAEWGNFPENKGTRERVSGLPCPPHRPSSADVLGLVLWWPLVY